MSLRLEMLQVARLAPKALEESSALVGSFLLGQQNEDGGFRDRTGTSDLYYTVFGLEGLLALNSANQVEWSPCLEKLTGFLMAQQPIENLDFVHVCCLARCWASALTLGGTKPPLSVTEAIRARLATFRARDGGFHARTGAARGTAYGAFLALGAWQDLGVEEDGWEALVDSLEALQTPDGVWANEPGMTEGSTNATAAALTILNNRGRCLPARAIDWLARCQHGDGGFKAMPRAPMPDLLSTATALHALSNSDWNLEASRERHLDFIDSLWTNAGAFHGHWADEDLDCEYTYYGLLALGHLSV